MPIEVRRRHVLAGLAGIGLLAACGAPGSTADTGATRTVEGAFGPAEVPVRPRRVVAMYPTAADYALVVGLPLVGAPGARGAAAADFPAHQPADLLSGVQRVTTFPEPDVEAIAALGPDLVFDDTSISEPAVHDRLARIAPVHTFPPSEQIESLSWRDHLRRTAEVFDAGAAAEAFTAEHDDRAAALRERVAARWAGAAFAYVNPLADGWNVAQLTNQTSSTLVEDLGLAAHPLNPAAFAQRVDYSLEEIGVLSDVDLLVVRVEAAAEGAGTDRTDLGGVLGSPLWAELPAVRAGAVVEVDAELFYRSPYTALATLDWAGRTLV